MKWDADLRCVQEQPGETKRFANAGVVLAAAVRGVANHRMPEVFAVPTHLMKATRVRLCGHKRVVLFTQQGPSIQRRRDGMDRGARIDPNTPFVFGDRMIDENAGRKHTSHQRDVALCDAALRKRAAKFPRSLDVFRAHERTARAPVQAVNGDDLRTPLVAKPIDNAVGLAREPTMHHEPAGLVDRNQVVVFIENRKRARWAVLSVRQCLSEAAFPQN